MSDIIIEGKNLSDINQSNFQTVGVRGSINFATNYVPNSAISVENNNFQYNTYDVHVARLGQNFEENLPGRVLLPKGLRFITLEPWQGRIHYDEDFVQGLLQSENPYEGLGMGFATQDLNYWQPNSSERGVISVPTGLDYASTSRLYFPYFYTSFMFDQHFSSDIVNTNYRINDFYKRIGNRLGYGAEEREPNVLITKDDRFPLGTYTEENKQYWEIQTSDPITRNSQMSSERMKVAQSTKDGVSKLIKSEEEQFSVDLFTFTEREGVTTPLFFYYDKNLHPIEYNKATTGKISFKIELRASGRNGSNELDLYRERKPIRPFLLGLEKDELRNGGTTVGSDPEELIGEGDVFGEGLYYGDQYLTLTAEPNEQSYLLGIYDIPDDNLVSRNSPYAFTMPFQDVQYLARFRPNPYIVLGQKFIDENGNEIQNTAISKGEVRAWVSEVVYFGDETNGGYVTTPPNFIQETEEYIEIIQAARAQLTQNVQENGMSIGEALQIFQNSIPILDYDIPDFKIPGNRYITNNQRPKDFGGDLLTLEQRPVTNNYKFKGWTYLSGSDSVLTPLTEVPQTQTTGPDGQPITVDVDQNYSGTYFGHPGGNANNIKTIRLVEDFRYPNGRLSIFANYGLIVFTIENLNNQADFENNFSDALKFGPFKFVTARGNSPSIDDYRFDDITQFPAFEVGEPNVRLLLSGPGMGYANADYLPSGDNAHLTLFEDIPGYAPGNFFYYRNTGEGTGTEKIPIKIDITEPIPNTMANAIELNGGLGPTPTTVAGNAPEVFNNLVDYDDSPSGFSVGTIHSSGLFKVTSVDFISENSAGGVYGLTWGPRVTNQTRIVNKFRLDENERSLYQGIQLGDVAPAVQNFQDAVIEFGHPIPFDNTLNQYTLIGGPNSTAPQSPFEVGLTLGGPNNNLYIIEDIGSPIPVTLPNTGAVLYNKYEVTFGINPNLDASFNLLTSHVTNEIVSTENTSSISYEPLQKGTYVKSIDLGANTDLRTTIGESGFSATPIRSKEDSGAIDADMYGFGDTYRINMTPSQESMPPEINAYVANENVLSTDLVLSTDFHPTLTLDNLGVTWQPDEWSPQGGGILQYTIPSSRDATYVTDDGTSVPRYFKYVEFRIQTLQTAEGEQSENNEPVDPSFYIGLNVFGMPGSGGQIFNDFNYDQDPELISTGGLQNLFNVAEIVDENGIPYQEFSQIPVGQLSTVLRAVPDGEPFTAGQEGSWSFIADPGQDVDQLGTIVDFLDDNGHHIGIVTFFQEGPVTVKYQWFSGQGNP